MTEMIDSDDDGERPKKGQARKTGYRSPPPEHQFKPGQSGNPRGRPKGAKGMRSELLRELNETVVLTVNGKLRKLNKLQYLIKKTVREGSGDGLAMRERIQLLNMIAQLLGPEERDEGQSRQMSEADRRLLDQLLGADDLSDVEASDEAGNSGDATTAHENEAGDPPTDDGSSDDGDAPAA